MAGRREAYFTQWAGQFFVAAELTRRGYVVSFPLGNAPVTDLQVTAPSGKSFAVEVKSLRAATYWLIKRPNVKLPRFYVLVHVPRDVRYKAPRFFVLTTQQMLAIHRDDPKWPGMNWGAAGPFLDRWNTLPR